MKVAVTSQGKTMDSMIDPRFGRCQYFLIIDLDTDELEVIENSAAAASGDAGVRAAQILNDAKVDALITGNVGPNAIQGLKAGDIKVYTGATGTVESAVNALKKGDLDITAKATVQSHFGTR
jgi:predicted Fe-Mo cluster-binding NifX family protein